jgi:hypothetical protein
VRELIGDGTISARGGSSSANGAGGGGRIAIYYDTLDTRLVNIFASGGAGGNGAASFNGGAGTVYLKPGGRPRGDLIIDNRGVDSAENSTPIPAVGRGLISSLTATSLTNGNAGWTPGALKGMKVIPDLARNDLFTVVDNTATTVFVDPNDGDLRSAAATGNIYTGVYHLNSVKIAGKARAGCGDRIVVDDVLLINNGQLTARDIFADKVSLLYGGLLTHSNTTAAAVYRLELNTTATLTIDSASRIDVTGRGYPGGYASGNINLNGRTAGNTTAGGSTSYNGGGYGGLGGIYTAGSGTVNRTYGIDMGPDDVGSGGGAYSSGISGGNGGGLVKISADTLVLDGGILAEGESKITTPASYPGAGSGGGIYIMVSTLSSSGTGTISANGGTSSYGGGGGGGKISLFSTSNNLPHGNITALGGLSGNGGVSTRNGGAGTVYTQTR